MKRLMLLMLVGCGYTPPAIVLPDGAVLDSGEEPEQDAGHDAGPPLARDAGDDGGQPDAGAPDAGDLPSDGGSDAGADAGPLPADAGGDAGPGPDAGPVDAGSTPDAGSADAGAPTDAGVDAGSCTPGELGCGCAYNGMSWTCAPGSDPLNPVVCNAQTNRCVNCGYPGGPCCGGANGTCEGSGQCLHHTSQVWQCHVGYVCDPNYPPTFYYGRPCFEGGCCGGASCYPTGCGP